VKTPNRIGNRNAGKQRKTNESIDRKDNIPVRTITAIAVAVVLAKTTIVGRIGGANAQRNTNTAAAEAEKMPVIIPVTKTTVTIGRGAIRVTTNLIGRMIGGNEKKTYGRNVASEKIRDAAAMTIRLRRHRITNPMILRTSKKESKEKTKKGKRRRKAANQKNAGVLFLGKK
jgi:hypothetical protein